MRSYDVVTIFNDPAQYGAMAETFRAAGFGPDRARFVPCDNSTGNDFDPFGVIRSLADTAGGRVVILCHQDVRLDCGDGVAELDAILDTIDAADPDWAVLGNAGVNYHRLARRWLNSPGEPGRTAPVPESCLSLDENLLIFNPRRPPAVSPGLSGFHLYGTDAVLNAAMTGRRCYVIPFLLTHLSKGNVDSPEFKAACRAFSAAWSPRLFLGIINTTCANFVLSRRRRICFVINRFWRIRHGLARLGVTFAPHWWNALGLGRASGSRLARRIKSPPGPPGRR